MRLKRVPSGISALEFRRISSKRTPKISFSLREFRPLFLLLRTSWGKMVAIIVPGDCWEHREHFSPCNTCRCFGKYHLLISSSPAWRFAILHSMEIYVPSGLCKVTRLIEYFFTISVRWRNRKIKGILSYPSSVCRLVFFFFFIKYQSSSKKFQSDTLKILEMSSENRVKTDAWFLLHKIRPCNVLKAKTLSPRVTFFPYILIYIFFLNM